MSYIFTGFIFVITCQDIALDSWAVEMLHEENASWAGSAQSIGQSLGFFISSSIFISLNSKEFCGAYFGMDQELWTLQNFLFWYAIILMSVTCFVAFFVAEADS